MNAYHERITELFDEYYAASKDDKPTPSRRIDASNALIEEYIEQYGKRPPNAILSRLATYILLDTLTDSHPDKMSRDEYPIMSYGQIGRYFERNTTKAELEYEGGDVRGRVKRPFITDDGATWVADGVILNGENTEIDSIIWRTFLREILTEREVRIVEMAYGEGASHAEIGEELGISRQRVGAIMAVIYDKISEIINA